MDSNTSLALTAKGVEEVKHRTCKLSIRKRSVLLLLETPHRVDHLLQKTVLQPEEFAVERIGNSTPSHGILPAVCACQTKITPGNLAHSRRTIA